MSNVQEPSRPAVFSAFADARTGNRGAVSMLESAIDHLVGRRDGVVNVFTVYPRADRKLPPTDGVTLHSGTPWSLAFRLVPLCVLYRFCRLMHLNLPRRLWGRAMNALLDTDVCLMIGGTTFSDAKQLKVPYNVLCTLPAILLGKKAMMYSQTLGPFRRRFNRFWARWSLSRMDVVVPRGPESLRHVQGLNLSCRVQYCPDAAFSLIVPQEVQQEVRAFYADLRRGGRRVVGLAVNSIVERECRRHGIDHHAAWVEFIDRLVRDGYVVLMIPHSMRRGGRTRHNNDLISIVEIHGRLQSQDGVHVIDDPYDCKRLREVVGLCDYFVASRFHSMISALCCGVPVLVFGWGYQKYREVLEEFELADYCHDAAELSGPALIEGFGRLVREDESIRRRIAAHLDAIRAASQANHDLAWELYQRPGGGGRA